MAWTRVLLLLALAFAAANAAGDTFCGKKTKKIVTIEQGDKVVFKTQREKAKKYLPNTRCIATYKLGSTCSEMKLSCSTSRIGNKDKQKCMKGDKMIVIGEKKSEKFCGTRKPKKTIKRGLMKVIFFSDKKNNAPGTTCSVKCSSKKETNPTMCSRDDVLLLVGGSSSDMGGVTLALNSSEVYGSPDYSVPELPSPRDGVNVVFFDNQVLACGGSEDIGFTSDDKCYSLESTEWVEHSNMGSGRRYASPVVAGQYLYMLGGQSESEDKTSSVKLAAGSKVWVPGPNMPESPHYMVKSCSVGLGDGFVIIGSSTGYGGYVNHYNGSWHRWDNLPSGRYGHSCISYTHLIMVAGGYTDDYAGRVSGGGSYSPTTTTVLIDTVTKANFPGPQMLQPRTHFIIANINGMIISVGSGSSTAGETFDFDSSTSVPYKNLTTIRNLLGGAVVPKSALGCS